MKSILVPIMSAADVAAIPNLVKYLKVQSPTAVVVLCAPSVGITSEDATKEVDERISRLQRAKKEAADREDYAGAEQYKQQIEEAKLSRQELLRNGWKSVSQDQRDKAYAKLDEHFRVLNTTHVRRRVLVEDPENPIAAIGALLNDKSWPDCLPKDAFSIVLPRSVGEVKTFTGQTADKAIPEPSKTVNQTVEVDPKESRRKELGRYFAMKKAAEHHNIPYEGRKSADVVADILAKEFPG